MMMKLLIYFNGAAMIQPIRALTLAVLITETRRRATDIIDKNSEDDINDNLMVF